MSKQNQNCLPAFFPLLLTLHVCNRGSIHDLVPTIASLLKGTPNLQCLCFAAYDSIIASKLVCHRLLSLKYINISLVFVILLMNFWALQEYDKTKTCQDLEDIPFLHNLKTLIIEFLREGENLLKMIKYLLKHAKNLQKMTVSYNSLKSYVRREIDGYEKASSLVEVNFHQG